MEIRPANVIDLNACLAIDDSFETEYVWQMEERTNAGVITVTFRQTRLPRPMRVANNISRSVLLENFQRGEAFFVADEAGVCGFVDAGVSVWNQMFKINNIAIAPVQRRRGVGAKLMRAALEWARERQLRIAMLDTSTKDYPAICFYQKLGFTLCGFNDQLFPNRDIALQFALNLR
ncbi:MAG: GNAT family N-acetyltransferase [Chloroflexi bacterium]|nr:GNAT family N-acetyltransferase [Chloroflexota bacterium]